MPSFPLILAQEVADSGASGFNWFYLFNPAVVWVLIPVSAIVIGTVATIIHRSQQHRERMAMIAAGMHPDYPPDEEPNEGRDGSVRETAAYRSQ